MHLVLTAFVVASLGGVERLAHLETLASDPLLVQYLRLSYWPVRKVFATALASLDAAGRQALADYVSELGLSTIASGSASVVVDLDTTALIDYGEGEGSQFGYCGKGRRRRRHYPLVASVACSRAIVLARYRTGRQVTADELVDFLTDLLTRLRDHLGANVQITVRSDAGIFCKRVASFLVEQGVSFVMALPLSARVKEHVPTLSFVALDEDIETVRLSGEEVGQPEGFFVALVRRAVHDRKAPPQGKKVAGQDDWRFQAIVSDRAWDAVDLWRFYNGRADCERVFRIGKQGLGLGHLVSRRFRANETAFLLRAVAFNADLLFQAYCEQLAQQHGRKAQIVGLEWRQVYFYRTPGRLVRSKGRWILHVPADEVLARLWRFYAPDGLTGPSSSEVSAP